MQLKCWKAYLYACTITLKRSIINCVWSSGSNTKNCTAPCPYASRSPHEAAIDKRCEQFLCHNGSRETAPGKRWENEQHNWKIIQDARARKKINWEFITFVSSSHSVEDLVIAGAGFGCPVMLWVTVAACRRSFWPCLPFVLIHEFMGQFIQCRGSNSAINKNSFSDGERLAWPSNATRCC